MSSRKLIEHGLSWFYDQVTGDEDARVCKDIPEQACEDQPRNFFAYLCANFLNKISDELVSARLTLPWLFSVLGVPASFIGFLVPIREAGVLLPQLIVAAYIRAMSQRKVVWLLGALLSTMMLFLMAFISWNTSGVLAGWLIIFCLIFYSLARGLCSVSAKDVLGKTISKTRRGRLMGYSTSLAGLATLTIGFLLQTDFISAMGREILVMFIIFAGISWLFALCSFNYIIEPAGSTEGGGNAFDEAIRSLGLLVQDKLFQKYVISRVLLLSVALVIPFYVVLVQQLLNGELTILGWLIIANGLASSLSAPLIGKYADHNSRNVMALSALLAGVVGLIVSYLTTYGMDVNFNIASIMVLFFLISLAHGGVRLGRKVYLVDMANKENRAQYVAVSNTVIGIVMLLAGSVGVIADLFNVQTVIFILSVISLFGSAYIMRLSNVSG